MGLARRAVGVLLVLAALGAVVQSYATTDRFRSYVECQARYNEINNVRTRALVDATDQERHAERAADDAERRLFTDPATTTPAGERSPADQARLLDLFRAYQAALSQLALERAEADKARGDHPVPAPPSEVCG
jgi:uncharacterized protein (DUF1501 family)